MRVVIDTVILVRGLIGPYSQWGRVLFEGDDAYEWIVSPQIVEEYLEVIGRPEIVRKYRAVERRNVQMILRKIADATLVEPVEFPAICRDPEDDKFVAAAIASGAQFIISEDRDLLALELYEGVAICSAEEFLRHLIGDQDG